MCDKWISTPTQIRASSPEGSSLVNGGGDAVRLQASSLSFGVIMRSMRLIKSFNVNVFLERWRSTLPQHHNDDYSGSIVMTKANPF